MDNQFLPTNRSQTTAYYQTDINALVSIYLEQAKNLDKKVVSETTIGAATINSLIRYIIGPGLEPKASPEMTLLGWTQEQRNKFVAQSEAFFRRYAGSRKIDYYGREDFGSLQSIALRNTLNGDALMHLMYGLESQGYNPMLQVLSGRWVCNEKGMADTKNVVAGVIFDDEGREIGYQIRQTDENNLDTFSVRKVNKYNESGFEEFRLILIQPREANQVRGIPWLAPATQDIFELEKFKIAHRVKAATQAVLTAAIKSDVEAPVQPVSSIEKLRSLERKESKNGPLTGNDNNAEISLGAGNIVTLNPGESIDMLESKAPMASYKEYVLTELPQIGGATGVPYEMLTQSYNSNFSSSRATIMSAEKTFKVIRQEFATKFCAPVWEFVIDWGIRQGAIEAPGYVEGTDFFRGSVLASTWIGPATIVLDPTREINAHVQAIQNNLETREIATRELLGMDFDEVTDQLANEKRILEKKGLTTTVFNSFNQKAPQEDESQEQEQEQKEENTENEDGTDTAD